MMTMILLRETYVTMMESDLPPSRELSSGGSSYDIDMNGSIYIGGCSNSNDDGYEGNRPQHQWRIIFPGQETSGLRRCLAAFQPKSTSTNEDSASMLLVLGSSVPMG